MDNVQQPEEQKKQVPEPSMTAGNNKRKAKNPKKRMAPRTEDENIAYIEKYKTDAMKAFNKIMDMEIDFKKVDDKTLDNISMSLQEIEKRAAKAEQIANTIIDYQDAEYDVDAFLEGKINKFVPVEQITVFDTGYEPLNQKLTAFVNAPVDPIDNDIYRCLENIMDVHKMVLDVRADGTCPLIDEIFCDDETNTIRYEKYVNFLRDIFGRVNKRIACKLMERVTDVNTEWSTDREEKKGINGENAGSTSATVPIEPNDDLYRFEKVNPDEMHQSIMQKIKTGIESGVLKNVAQLEAVDDPNEVSSGDVCDLEKTRDDDIRELDEEEEGNVESDNDDKQEDGVASNGIPSVPDSSLQSTPPPKPLTVGVDAETAVSAVASVAAFAAEAAACNAANPSVEGIVGEGAPPDDAIDAIVDGEALDVIELSSGNVSDAEEGAFDVETEDSDEEEYEEGDQDDVAGYDPDEIMEVDETFNDGNSSSAGSDVITLD